MENHDLLEFDKLKDEQIGRLAYRDNLFYLSMGIIGGIVATYFAYEKAEIVLLWLPFAMFIVGVAHLTCERRVQDIGLYVRKRLAPLLAKQTGQNPSEIFAWETFFRESRWHPWRKRLHLVSSVMLYVLSGAVAVGTYWHANGHFRDLDTAEKFLVGVDIALILAMSVLIGVFEKFTPDHAIMSDTDAAPRRHDLFKRLLLASTTAIAAGAAVYYGAKIVAIPSQWFDLLAPLHLALPSVLVVALSVAFLAWTITLLSPRH